jgi:Protein of unknown function (DUF2442)
VEKFHSIENVRCESGILSLTVDGHSLAFQLEKVSKLLANASNEQLDKYEISPGGYGIHWPLIDADISIDGLLGVTHQPNLNRKSA